MRSHICKVAFDFVYVSQTLCVLLHSRLLNFIHWHCNLLISLYK